MGIQLLIVEDEKTTQILLKSTLENEFTLTFAASAAEALEKLKDASYNLIILDLGLPDLDGHQLCSKLRNEESSALIPIIILSGRAHETDKLMGFTLGADDYVTKPFNPPELKARIRARLRNNLPAPASPDVITSGALQIHLRSQRIYLLTGNDQIEIPLTTLEFKLLHYFVLHPDHVLTRQQILDAVWGRDAFVQERTIDTHISKLRKKLAKHVDCLSAVHGAGYRYTKSPTLRVA